MGEVRCGLGVGLHRARGRQQVSELDQGRRGPAALLGSPLKQPIFVLQSKRADPADVIDGEKVVHRIEQSLIDGLAAAARLLAALGVVALNDLATPTIRLGVGEDSVEDGSVASLAMELRTGD